jgi:hypothetical protein
MQALVDRHCPKADVIRVVLDNLSTHSVAALYQTFDPGEARRIARKLEFYYVPKHASWLNMVEIEIEIGILKQRCLSRGIADRETLVRDVAAWEKCRKKCCLNPSNSLRRGINCQDSWDHVSIRSWPIFKSKYVFYTMFTSGYSLLTS